MNARQKVKALKKELEKLKEGKTNGYKWLKIDGAKIEQLSYFYANNNPTICLQEHFKFKIGNTIFENDLCSGDEVIIIDSAVLDSTYEKVIMERRDR